MKFRPRILVGVSVFLSIYIGALYAFAVNVAPGTVLDPAGLPGAYTVSLIGYDSDHNVETIVTGDSDEATVGFSVENSSNVSLLEIMNDGTFKANRSVASGDFTLGTHDFTHPITSDPITFSGSSLVLTGGDFFDSGISDAGVYQATGSHYVSSTLYQGFDVTTNDASIFAWDLSGGNLAAAVTVDPTKVDIVATPDNVNVNRIRVNGDTDGIVFTGADDLTTSVLAQFENDSGNELLQIKNDGSFTSQVGDLQLINMSSVTVGGVLTVPMVGMYYEDSDFQYLNGILDGRGIGGTIFPEVAVIDKNTLDSYFFAVDDDGVRMGFSNSFGAGPSHSLNMEATGAIFDTVDDLSTTEGVRIENDSGTTLFSVYNDGTVLLPNILTTTPKSGINQAGAAVTIAGGKGTGVAAGGSVIFQTSDVLTPPQSTVVQSLTTKLTLAGSGNLTMASLDKGNGVAGSVLEIGRNTNSTNTGAGSVNFLSKSGTAGYVWQDAAGNVRINTSAPSNANDTAGTVLGNQTSTRETKQDILDYTDYATALQKIIDAPLHTFRYIREVEGYGSDSPLAKTRLGYIADEVDPIFMTGNAIDQVSVNGLLMGAVKELNLQIHSVSSLASDGSFASSLRIFFADVANGISEFVAGTIRARDRLCIDDICLTKDQLRSLIESQSSESSPTSDFSVSDNNSNNDEQILEENTNTDTSLETGDNAITDTASNSENIGTIEE